MKMHWKCYVLVIFVISETFALTKQQLKNSGKLVKKNCMGKLKVTEEQVGDIMKGKFLDERDVKCYMACVYQMSQIIKNNKISYEATIKQIDMMYPAEMKESMKKSVENCKHLADVYSKDLCEASFQITKCLYEDNPKDFFFV